MSNPHPKKLCKVQVIPNLWETEEPTLESDLPHITQLVGGRRETHVRLSAFKAPGQTGPEVFLSPWGLPTCWPLVDPFGLWDSLSSIPSLFSLYEAPLDYF